MASAATTAPAFPSGPALGTPFPDFTLPDQQGRPVTFSLARAGKPAMVVLYRSASW